MKARQSAAYIGIQRTHANTAYDYPNFATKLTMHGINITVVVGFMVPPLI